MGKYELCCECGNRTGRAGRKEDSLYIEDNGPYCAECFDVFSPAPDPQPDAPVDERVPGYICPNCYHKGGRP